MDAKQIGKKYGQIIRDGLAQFGTVRDPVLTSGVSVIEQGIIDAINEDRRTVEAKPQPSPAGKIEWGCGAVKRSEVVSSVFRRDGQLVIGCGEYTATFSPTKPTLGHWQTPTDEGLIQNVQISDKVITGEWIEKGYTWNTVIYLPQAVDKQERDAILNNLTEKPC
jgi:hypothetical protein